MIKYTTLCITRYHTYLPILTITLTLSRCAAVLERVLTPVCCVSPVPPFPIMLAANPWYVRNLRMSVIGVAQLQAGTWCTPVFVYPVSNNCRDLDAQASETRAELATCDVCFAIRIAATLGVQRQHVSTLTPSALNTCATALLCF